MKYNYMTNMLQLFRHKRKLRDMQQKLKELELSGDVSTVVCIYLCRKYPLLSSP